MLTWQRDLDRLTGLAGTVPVCVVDEGWKGEWTWTLDLCGTRRGQAKSEFSARVEAETAFSEWLQAAGLRWAK